MGIRSEEEDKSGSSGNAGRLQIEFAGFLEWAITCLAGQQRSLQTGWTGLVAVTPIWVKSFIEAFPRAFRQQHDRQRLFPLTTVVLRTTTAVLPLTMVMLLQTVSSPQQRWSSSNNRTILWSPPPPITGILR